MPKKKKKVVSLEVLEVNSKWDYQPARTLRNFICNAEDAEKTVQDMDIKELWKHEPGYQKQMKAILAPEGTRNASTVFFTDDVAVEEVKLPLSMKTIPPYVYKYYDYTGEKCTTEYGTMKDILAYISKKVKTKYAYVTYNGKTRKIEYSPKAVSDILTGLQETTSQFEIEPVGRSGNTDTMIMVSTFKNCVK